MDLTGKTEDETASALAHYQPDGIVTFVDHNLEACAAVAARLGLPFHSPEVAATLVDKRRQRALLAKAGVPGPRAWPLNDDFTSSDITDLAVRLPYPCVLKPARGSGSRNVYAIGCTDELVSTLAAQHRPEAWLVEEMLLDDPHQERWHSSFASVESVVTAGDVSHLAVTGRLPVEPPFRETGSFVPGVLEGIPSDALLSMATRAIEALQINWGMVHTEIKATPAGLAILEVNGRLGGLVPYILGRVSAVDLFQVAFLVAAGGRPRPPAAQGSAGLVPCDGVGFWALFPPPLSAHRVESVSGIDELLAIPGIDDVLLHRAQGDGVDWREGFSSNVASVTGRADDHADMQKTLRAARTTLKVTFS